MKEEIREVVNNRMLKSVGRNFISIIVRKTGMQAVKNRYSNVITIQRFGEPEEKRRKLIEHEF